MGGSDRSDSVVYFHEEWSVFSRHNPGEGVRTGRPPIVKCSGNPEYFAEFFSYSFSDTGYIHRYQQVIEWCVEGYRGSE